MLHLLKSSLLLGLCAVLLMGGAAAMQAVAWSGMFLSSWTQTDTLSAFADTFNPENMCGLCEVIQEQVAQPEQQALQSKTTKLYECFTRASLSRAEDLAQQRGVMGRVDYGQFIFFAQPVSIELVLPPPIA